MKLPEKIAGEDPRVIRNLFRELMARDTAYTWQDGLPSVVPRRVTVELLEKSLGVSCAKARRIQCALVAEGWLKGSFVPSTSGMALSQHIDRPALPRAQAEAILDQVIAWAMRVNRDFSAGVRIKEISLFGSMLSDQAEVGDIDLFIEFTTVDLGEDIEPEDLERETELFGELTAISEYISPSGALERMMLEVPERRIFPLGEVEGVT